MSTDPHDEHPGDVPPRDPDPETEAGDGGTSSADSGAGEQDPSSPEAIENDPSTAGGPSDEVPDEVERLRGG